MKKAFSILFTCLALMILSWIISCSSGDSLSVADRNVVSAETDIKFEELLILINLKASDSTYLVVKSVDSVNIFINDHHWAVINSQPIDTSIIEKYVIENMFHTSRKLNYLVVAKDDIEEPDYNTAGEFANYLNDFYELAPGDYACLIESFQVTYNDSSTQTFHPYEYKIFRVEENVKSASVGEIQLNIE